MLSTPIEVGKKYRRRNGLISICTKISWISSHHGDTVKYDCGPDTWKSNGRTNMNYESDEDIIEEVKENKMKIEVGKYYKTRSGHKAFVAFEYNSVNGFTHGGVVYGEQNAFDVGCSWYELGNHIKREMNNDFDLIEEWKEPKSGVAYVNIYISERGEEVPYIHTTKELADKQDGYAYKEYKRKAFIRVEWKEGQFDD